MAESYHASIEEVQNPRLRQLAAGLLDLVDLVVTLDDLPPTTDLRLSDVPASQAESLGLLRSLYEDLRIRELANAVDRLPEEVLVQRLRELHTPWQRIADCTDYSNASGLYKRYRTPGDAQHPADPTV